MPQSRTGAEVDGHLEIHALPVRVKQDAELLRSAQREHGDQDLCKDLLPGSWAFFLGSVLRCPHEARPEVQPHLAVLRDTLVDLL